MQQTETEPRPHALQAIAGASFYGWWVLVALAAMRVVASGVGHNVLGLLVLPLEEEFGAKRATVSLMVTSGNIAVATTAILGGWLMDRFGARRIMLWSLMVAASGYIMLSQAQALWQVILIFTIPLGVAYNWAVLNSGAPILNNWFERQKARALSLLNVGHGSGALLLPLMALAISELGWRTAVVAGGMTLLAFGLVAVAVVRDTPEEMGLTPDGDPPREPVSGVASPASAAGATLKQAVRTPFFWTIGLGTGCMLFVNLSLVIHLVPLMEWKGESEGLGAGLLSFQLVLTVPIVLVTAWAADRFGGTRVLTGMMLLTSLGVVVLFTAESLLLYVPAMALLAFGGSNWPVLWAVLGHAYGRRHYNSIRMAIYTILIAGMSGGPVLAGLSFDETQSYSLWLQILMVVGSLGVLSFILTVRSHDTAARLARAA
jgi:MFS family permease